MSVQPRPGDTAHRESARRGAPRATLTLVRHAEPDWQAVVGSGEDRDPGLTGFGRAQAEATAARLASERWDALYVSPMRRCRETAEPFARESGLEPRVVPELEEIRVGASGMDLDEVDAYFRELSARPLEEHWTGWPGAEDFRDFHRRAVSGLEDLLGRHDVRPRPATGEFATWEVPEDAGSLIVVAHGGTNAVLLTHLLGVAPVPWEWLRFECELSAYAVVQARPLGPEGGCVWSLVNFNELDHLRAAGLR